jgi:hypothetical protein
LKGVLAPSSWRLLIPIMSASVATTGTTASTTMSAMISTPTLAPSTSTPTLRFVLSGCVAGTRFVRSGRKILGQLDHLSQLAVVSSKHVVRGWGDRLDGHCCLGGCCDRVPPNRVPKQLSAPCPSAQATECPVPECHRDRVPTRPSAHATFPLWSAHSSFFNF